MNALSNRIVTQTEAREVLGISRTLFLRMQAQGILPQPLPGTKRYDLKAIEHALDRIAGVQGDATAGPNASESPAESYERWKASQGM